MPKSHPRYAPEYRRRMIELVRAGRPRPIMLIVAGLGHGVMQARQLRGLKRRAEAAGEGRGGGATPK